MPIYKYKAIDDYGKEVGGQLEAESEKDLAEKLSKQGYYLLDAKEIKELIRTHAVHSSTETKKTPKITQSNIYFQRQEIFLDFNIPLILGIIGLLFNIGGCFAPFVRIPILGHYSLFFDGKGDGIIVLILSSVAIWLLFAKRYKNLLIPTGLSATVVLAAVIRFIYLKSSEPPDTQLVFDNPFEEAGRELGKKLGEMFIQTIQLDWGLGILVIGHILVFTAIGLGIKKGIQYAK